jgi:hypothetical protein
LGSLPISSLPDGSHLVDLVFNYSSALGTNYSELTWQDDGSSCEYADSQNNPLVDTPTDTYYKNGVVASHVAPRTKAETIAFATVGGTVSVPVNVWNFNNIASFSLTLDFDPAVLTFINATPNPSIASTLSASATNGRLLMGWYYTGQPGTSLSLPDSTQIVYLNFTFHGGTSTLNFFNNGGTCEYTEGITNDPLYDLPTATYYINGAVIPNRTVNLKVFLEGLYNSASHQMNHARNSLTNQYPGTTADQISVEFHNGSNYSNVVYTAANVNLSTTGLASVLVPAQYNSSYYITIKHWNAIETVSASAISLAGTITGYAFDAAAKAYGNNLHHMSDGSWTIYCGDINQDGTIDTGDMTPLENDMYTFLTGYLVTDLNGDGTVDSGDITFIDNNMENFITRVTP